MYSTDISSGVDNSNIDLLKYYIINMNVVTVMWTYEALSIAFNKEIINIINFMKKNKKTNAH
jgi:hypothetical protein